MIIIEQLNRLFDLAARTHGTDTYVNLHYGSCYHTLDIWAYRGVSQQERAAGKIPENKRVMGDWVIYAPDRSDDVERLVSQLEEVVAAAGEPADDH